MTSQDDLTLLKQMYQRGEISDEEYDVLRRHVLWGTPLPELIDEPPPMPPGAGRPATRQPGPPSQPHTDARGIPAARQPAPPGRLGRDRDTGQTAIPAGAYRAGGGQSYDVEEPTVTDFRSVPTSRPGAKPYRDTAAKSGTPRRGPGRRRRGPALAVVVLSLVLAAALTAAGVWWFTFREKPGVPAATYARSVCTGVRDWQQDVDGQGSVLTRTIAPLENLTAVRAAVVKYYTNLAARTDDLHGTLASAGIPKLDGGQGYADALTRVVTEQAAALRDSASRAGRLDIANKQFFQISLGSLLTNASTSVLKVTDALAHPLTGIPPELATALEADPTCAAYTG